MDSDRFQIGDILYLRNPAEAPKFIDTPVYRFMSFETLIEMVRSTSIFMVKTKYWEDTYENFLFKSEIIVGDTPFDLTSHLERTFGSCWTKKRESDALWRIYSQNKAGVRVRSTVGKLVKCIQQHFTKSIGWTACIGEVQYVTTTDIVSHFERFSEGEFVAEAGRFFRDSMFMKRPEFSHEDEVRIIFKAKRDASISTEVVALPIDPREVVEEITFDPRMNQELLRLLLSKLSLLGCDQITNKSSLYTSDRLRIQFKLSNPIFEIVDEKQS